MIVNESGEIMDRKLYDRFKKLLKGLKNEAWKSKEGVDGCEVIATFKTLDELLNLHCFNGKTILEIWDEMHRAWFSF